MANKRMLTINATEGFSEEAADTDGLLIGILVAAGVGGIAVDANSNRITEVAAPTAGSDAANKTYVDGLVNGLDWKQSCRLKSSADMSTWVGAAGPGVGRTLTSPSDATANNDFDSITAAVGERILVTFMGGTEATPDSDNGIYTLTTLADGAGQETVLTRATDADEDAEVTASMAVFVSEGTIYADTGWVLVTDDPITVDTTTLQFTQFTGIGSLVDGAGVVKTGDTLAVDLDTAADAQTAGTGGGSSGLEFDAAGDGGELRVKVDPAAGVQRNAGGLGLEIDDTPDTLDVDADGLKVVGLPSTFKINDVAVSAAVTAANVDILVGGTESSADALHRHDRVDDQFTADETIASDVPICWSPGTTINRVVAADAATDNLSRVIAISRTAAAAAANTLEACAHGTCPGVIAGATVGTPYYLGDGGGLSTSLPGANKRIIQVGFAINATDLWVKINDFGKKI